MAHHPEEPTPCWVSMAEDFHPKRSKQMDIRPAIQAMPLHDLQEMIDSFMANGPPTHETDRLFLQELLEQWVGLVKNPAREE